MKPFPIPVVAFGPGSQLDEGDELSYLSMPKAMHTFAMPSLPEADAVAGLSEAKRLLESVHAALADAQAGRRAATRFSLAGLDAANIALVNQVLGEGEVSAIVAGEPRVHFQESVFAGIWRMVRFATDGSTVADEIEIGGVPVALEVAAREFAKGAIHAPASVPDGVMNAPGVLAEIADRAGAWHPRQPAHVVNLTLLPLSREDVAYIGDVLGTGRVTILSRGYGNCRIVNTGVRNVWWVQYFNSQDALILNTIEVVGIPEAAVAAAEDIADSGERFSEVLNWIDGGSEA